MSTPDESGEPPTEKEEQAPTATSPMTRCLQTFGSPDLEVSIGKTERIYHCHSFILASQSFYVDAVLSSPAAKLAQKKMRISFPEVEIATWEKMMKYLMPTGGYPTLDDLLEIVPLYEKYIFQDGIIYCDTIISKIIPGDSFFPDSSHILKLSRLVSFTHELNSFPLSTPLAVEWAKRCLGSLFVFDEEIFRLLMPLVENDDNTIKSMVSTLLGRKCKGKKMNEMRDLVKEPDFPKKCISRCRQIREIDEQRKCLHVGNLSVHGHETNYVDGSYVFQRSSGFQQGYGTKFAVSHKGGAAVGVWRKESDEDAVESTIIESLDVFGSVWEIYTHPDNGTNNEEGAEHENRRVLFRWENGIFNSLCPPKYGWKTIDGSGNEGASEEVILKYTIDGISRCGY